LDLGQNRRQPRGQVDERNRFPLLGAAVATTDARRAGREIAGQYMEYDFGDGTHGFDYLDGRPINLAARDVPPPMSEPLEEASIPSVQQIVEAVKQAVGQ